MEWVGVGDSHTNHELSVYGICICYW